MDENGNQYWEFISVMRLAMEATFTPNDKVIPITDEFLNNLSQDDPETRLAKLKATNNPPECIDVALFQLQLPKS